MGKVFIVHGHDNNLIEDVKSCIRSIKLEPVVLREESVNGRTIIEKLEHERKECKCAIILYTPCDKGSKIDRRSFFSRGDSEPPYNEELRARQNVVFEHGLFLGCFGRSRIIILKKDNVILPSDCSGIGYIAVSDSDDWKIKLIQNIHAIPPPQKPIGKTRKEICELNVRGRANAIEV